MKGKGRNRWAWYFWILMAFVGLMLGYAIYLLVVMWLVHG